MYKDMIGKEVIVVDCDTKEETVGFVSGINDKDITISSLDTGGDLWCINHKTQKGIKYDKWREFTLKAIEKGRLVEKDMPDACGLGGGLIISSPCAFK